MCNPREAQAVTAGSGDAAETSTQLTGHPLFFERNRVFRVYRGGKLFHDFFGDAAEDGNLPEEWIASSVKALNRDSTDEKEGVSKVEGTAWYFDELLKAEKERMLGDRDQLGILVKALDSAIRLPIQAHPDKAFSRKYFHSEYGKAETWLVLATRENARIYFGFREKLTAEQFRQVVERSETEKDVMEPLLNEIRVQKGDVFFIPAKAVHAIGYGCLILEIQEPTDFTLQPESWCGDYHLNDYEKYLGLSQEVALTCFDYTLCGEKAVAVGRKQPRVYAQADGVTSEVLIGADDTDCFGVRRHRIDAGVLHGLYAPSVCVITDGQGEIRCGDYVRTVKKGDYFFLPYAAGEACTVQSDEKLELVECLPPHALTAV